MKLYARSIPGDKTVLQRAEDLNSEKFGQYLWKKFLKITFFI